MQPAASDFFDSTARSPSRAGTGCGSIPRSHPGPPVCSQTALTPRPASSVRRDGAYCLGADQPWSDIPKIPWRLTAIEVLGAEPWKIPVDLDHACVILKHACVIMCDFKTHVARKNSQSLWSLFLLQKNSAVDGHPGAENLTHSFKIYDR